MQSSDAGHRLASGQHSGTAVQKRVSMFLRLALWQLKAALSCSCSRWPERSPRAVQHAMHRGVQFAKLCGARGRAVCKAVRCSGRAVCKAVWCSGVCSLQSRSVLGGAQFAKPFGAMGVLCRQCCVAGVDGGPGASCTDWNLMGIWAAQAAPVIVAGRPLGGAGIGGIVWGRSARRRAGDEFSGRSSWPPGIPWP